MPSDAFYWSRPWRKVRAEFLAVNPRCVAKGCTAAANHVDHRTPRAAGGAPFDWTNLQGFCASHHSSKTAAQDGGFGNRRRHGAAPVRARGCDVQGNPLAGWHR